MNRLHRDSNLQPLQSVSSCTLQVETAVHSKFEEEHLRYDADKDFAVALLASFDHELCRSKRARSSMLKAIFNVQVIGVVLTVCVSVSVICVCGSGLSRLRAVI